MLLREIIRGLDLGTAARIKGPLFGPVPARSRAAIDLALIFGLVHEKYAALRALPDPEDLLAHDQVFQFPK